LEKGLIFLNVPGPLKSQSTTTCQKNIQQWNTNFQHFKQ